MGRKQLYHMRIVVVRFFQITFVASIESSIHGCHRYLIRAQVLIEDGQSCSAAEDKGKVIMML